MYLFLLSETQWGNTVLIFVRTFDPKLIKKRTVTNCATINIEHYLDVKNPSNVPPAMYEPAIRENIRI